MRWFGCADYAVSMHELKISVDQCLWSIDSFAQKRYGHFLGRLPRGKISAGPRLNVCYVVEGHYGVSVGSRRYL